MLLGSLLCLSPNVVLRGVVGGDGVGSIAGAAHCEYWLADDVVGVGGGCAVSGVVLIVVVGGDGDGSIAGAAHCECWLAIVVVGVGGGCGTGVVRGVTSSSQKSLP